MKYLVIVESPAKAKIIEKYLKSVNPEHHYTVKASFGHVRDLGKDVLSIDIENHYNVLYELLPLKEKVIKELKIAAQKADVIYLGTDNDREGESIAWHLKQMLPSNKRYFRITFNEITKTALQNAIETPRNIDSALVDAQQSRRVIDRLVGYKVSPLLWKNFNTKNLIKLSAGRVQSAALRVICDREDDIVKHVPVPYWNVAGSFLINSFEFDDCKLYMHDKIVKFDDKKILIKLIRSMEQNFAILSTKRELHKDKPDKPFITSTLQQEAYNKLGFPTKQTMKIAQDLYERGHITYMRTDSVCLSQDALGQIENFVSRTYGIQMFERRVNKTTKHAHEAIRPTHIDVLQVEKFGPKHAKLYKLVHDRTVASQMKDAIYEHNIAQVHNPSLNKEGSYFKGNYKQLVFPGWRLVYGDKVNKINVILEGDVDCKQIVGHNIWPSAPTRYNEASLVKFLEHKGIGRPSTYSSIIEKLFDKQYIVKQDVQGSTHETEDFIWKNNTMSVQKGCATINQEKSRMVATDVGKQVNAYMTSTFAYLVDTQFTNEMESRLDMVADGKLTYVDMVDSFWKLLEPLVAMNSIQKIKKTTLETAKQTISCNGIDYTLRLAKYGPVIEYGQKQFINLKPYLAIVRKPYTDLNERDVMLLTSLPIDLENGCKLCYGRYGLYVVKDGGVNVSITPFYIKKRFTSVYDVSSITLDDIEGLMKKKKDYQKKPR